MEYHNGAILHAAPSHLKSLDDAQNNFLHALQSNPSTAFLEYNFPLPTLRRDIGLLGLLHKRVLGLPHPAFANFFPWSPYPAVTGHDKQLYDFSQNVISSGLSFNVQFSVSLRFIIYYRNMSLTAIQCPAFRQR